MKPYLMVSKWVLFPILLVKWLGKSLSLSHLFIIQLIYYDFIRIQLWRTILTVLLNTDSWSEHTNLNFYLLILFIIGWSLLQHLSLGSSSLTSYFQTKLLHKLGESSMSNLWINLNSLFWQDWIGRLMLARMSTRDIPKTSTASSTRTPCPWKPLTQSSRSTTPLNTLSSCMTSTLSIIITLNSQVKTWVIKINHRFKT